MLQRSVFVAALLVLAGCAGTKGGSVDAGQDGYGASSDAWREAGYREGLVVYERSCGSCHDPGGGAAPTIGVQQDWDERSRQWTAVLFEHANKGYLEMPGKGGAAELSDEAVAAAAEYMMTVTYPDLPVD